MRLFPIEKAINIVHRRIENRPSPLLKSRLRSYGILVETSYRTGRKAGWFLRTISTVLFSIRLFIGFFHSWGDTVDRITGDSLGYFEDASFYMKVCIFFWLTPSLAVRYAFGFFRHRGVVESIADIDGVSHDQPEEVKEKMKKARFVLFYSFEKALVLFSGAQCSMYVFGFYDPSSLKNTLFTVPAILWTLITLLYATLANMTGAYVFYLYQYHFWLTFNVLERELCQVAYNTKFDAKEMSRLLGRFNGVFAKLDRCRNAYKTSSGSLTTGNIITFEFAIYAIVMVQVNIHIKIMLFMIASTVLTAGLIPGFIVPTLLDRKVSRDSRLHMF